ncbi:MAG: hypothetical protein ABJQ85_20285 [Rhizobiaceae bacterium]
MSNIDEPNEQEQAPISTSGVSPSSGSFSDLRPNRQKLQIRRVVSKHDRKRLRGLVRQVHEEGRFESSGWSEERYKKQFERLVGNQDSTLFLVAELGECPIALMVCQIGDYLLGRDVRLATVVAFNVAKQQRNGLLGGRAATRLLAETLHWARSKQAWELAIHVTSGLELARTDRFLKRAKFEVVGGNYVYRLQ